jgi:AraC-like DNA-binding protein
MISSELISPNEWAKKIAASLDSPIVGNRVTLNPVRGKGYLEWHAVEPGFDMMLTNIVQYKDFTFAREKSDYKGIMIKYLVETPDTFTSIGVNDKKHIVAEEGIFVSTPDYPETTHTKAEYRYKILVILLSFDWIKTHHEDHSFILNTAITENSVFAFEKVNPIIQRLSLNLFAQCESDFPYKTVNIRASATELLVKVFHLFDYRKNTSVRMTIKNQGDIDLLFRIRKRLVECLERNYPTIESLSDEFGISPTKLKTNFKILFGKPVFQYFQEERMELARKLIESGTFQISDVGFRIGYSNLSKFTSAYKKQFGFNPKDTPLNMSDRDKI